MKIYPAIDLMSGECVRLYQGRYDQVTVYENNPVRLAEVFAKQGASVLHIVDLDGAKQGKSVNLDLIIKIKEITGLAIQMGGGIRSRKQVSEILNQGIDRVILGSIAISNPDVVKEWIEEFGHERFVLAFDIRMDETNLPKLALHGWETRSEKNLWELLDEYQYSSLRHVLCTDIGRDGTLLGSNINLYTECVNRYPSIAFQASGGVSALTDLCALSNIPVTSVIVGKALYENKFSLVHALNEVLSC